MTFKTWSKELLCKELKNQGKMLYIRKPDTLQGWYCFTPSGLLLHVEPEKIRYGFFRFNYEIMPLVGRFGGSEYLPHDSAVTMDGSRDVAYDYTSKFEYPFGHKSRSLKTKEIRESATNEVALEMIHNYLNPLFDSLTSYENYCKSSIEIRLYPMERNEIKRRKLVELLFTHGINAGINRGEFCPSEYPADYPWFADRINQMPYVYALLGKFEDALAMIHGIRHVCLQATQNSYQLGYTTENNYLKNVKIIESKDCEIEVAMQEKDIVRVRSILEANYQRNRKLIYERLGLEISEVFPAL